MTGSDHGLCRANGGRLNNSARWSRDLGGPRCRSGAFWGCFFSFLFFYSNKDMRTCIMKRFFYALYRRLIYVVGISPVKKYGEIMGPVGFYGEEKYRSTILSNLEQFEQVTGTKQKNDSSEENGTKAAFSGRSRECTL